MERFYVEPKAMSENEAKITGDELKHLKNVLRLKAGDAVEVFDGIGRGYKGRLVLVDQAKALVNLESIVKEVRDSVLRVCLAQGIPKGEKMDLIVQKNTELGVDSIIPLELNRSVVHLEGDKKRRTRQERWQKVAKEAARQCGRLKVPEVSMPMSLDTLLQQMSDQDLLLIPWEEGGQSLKAFFTLGVHDGGKVIIIVGPEGGMSEDEVEAGRQAGGKVLTLGPRLLRTETAGMALLSILQCQWGDMG